MPKQKKNPWVAAILNFLFLGIGYIYAGKRVGFGIGLFVWGIFIYSLLMLMAIDIHPILWLDVLGVSILLGYDGYRTAEEVNKRK